jgi:TRAP-type C4-dicarboxylate transport system permease small subunit
LLVATLNKLDKALTWFEDWTLYLAVFVGLVSLVVNVFLRYGFNYTLAWSEELVREIIIYTTFIGCSAAIKNRSMITIDALVQLVPRLRIPLTYVSHLSVLAFSVMMIWLGIAKVQQQAATFQKTIILEIPLELVFAILPLMGIMMGIRTIQNMVLDYQQIKSGKSST